MRLIIRLTIVHQEAASTAAAETAKQARRVVFSRSDGESK